MAVSIETFPTAKPILRDLGPAILAKAHTLSALLSSLAADGAAVSRAAGMLVDALAAGQMALTCGNGGSAAEAQHLAGELVGRFRADRAPWPVMALAADPTVLTCVANDFGYEHVFARQVVAFGRPGDVFLGFSTSGSSPNVVNAARCAREQGLRVIAFTGHRPTRLGMLADVDLAVPSRDTALIQEAHTVLVHVICEAVEAELTHVSSGRMPR